MYAQLGNTTFEGLYGPDVFTRTFAPKFADINLASGKPITQFIGSDLDVIRLSMRLSNVWCDPDTEIASLKASADAGTPVPLLMGNGSFMGNYTLRNVSIDVQQSKPDGTTIWANLSVELTEYVEADALGSKQQSAQAGGFGMASNKPTAFTGALKAASTATQAMQQVRAARSQASRVQQAVQRAQAIAGEAEQQYRKARKAAKKCEEAMRSAQDVIQKAQNLQNYGAAAVTQLKQGIKNIQSVSTALKPPVNLTNLANANRGLQASMTNILSATAPISGLGGAKRA